MHHFSCIIFHASFFMHHFSCIIYYFFLQKISKEIKKLAERELSLEDMEEDDSIFMREERYKARFVKVWEKLCEVKGREPQTGRLIEQKFRFQGTLLFCWCQFFFDTGKRLLMEVDWRIIQASFPQINPSIHRTYPYFHHLCILSRYIKHLHILNTSPLTEYFAFSGSSILNTDSTFTHFTYFNFLFVVKLYRQLCLSRLMWTLNSCPD